MNVWPAAVIVPVRADPVLAATANPTEPLPVPETPVEIVIQVVFEPAVHAQVDGDAVTPNDPDPPASATLWSVGEIENVHGGGGGAAAACDTVNVLPAAVIVPLRAAPEFAATVKDTLPLPAPELPLKRIAARIKSTKTAKTASARCTTKRPKPIAKTASAL